ncbi:replication protein [Burkholderia cenocepacia]|nr:replication protein [Burkholderia cenocepacia]
MHPGGERSIDHTLELIEHKSGRSVEAVQFKVTRKQSTDTVEDGDVKNEALVEEVAKFGIPRSEARRLITQYGVQRIKAAIAYTLNRTTKKNATPVDNVAAYFRKALTHGYTLADGQGTETAAPAKESAQSKAGADPRQVSGGEGRGSRRVFPRAGRSTTRPS